MLYRLQTTPIGRAKSGGGERSAVAAAAYKSGTEITDERTRRIYNYTRKQGVIHSEIVAPPGEIAPDRARLWNMVERTETRKNARLARDCTGALDPDLPQETNMRICRAFATALAKRYKCVVDFSMHEPPKRGDQRNVHCHFQCTSRQYHNGQLGKKTDLEQSDDNLRKRGLPTGRNQIKEMRGLWERIVNEELKKAGKSYRVDARSYKDQGREIMPGIHLGPTDTAAERRGERTARGDYNRLVAAINAAEAELARRAAEAAPRPPETQEPAGPEGQQHEHEIERDHVRPAAEQQAQPEPEPEPEEMEEEIEIEEEPPKPNPSPRRPDYAPAPPLPPEQQARNAALAAAQAQQAAPPQTAAQAEDNAPALDVAPEVDDQGKIATVTEAEADEEAKIYADALALEITRGNPAAGAAAKKAVKKWRQEIATTQQPEQADAPPGPETALEEAQATAAALDAAPQAHQAAQPARKPTVPGPEYYAKKAARRAAEAAPRPPETQKPAAALDAAPQAHQAAQEPANKVQTPADLRDAIIAHIIAVAASPAHQRHTPHVLRPLIAAAAGARGDKKSAVEAAIDELATPLRNALPGAIAAYSRAATDAKIRPLDTARAVAEAHAAQKRNQDGREDRRNAGNEREQGR